MYSTVISFQLLPFVSSNDTVLHKKLQRVASFGSPIKPTATYFIFIPVDLLAVGLDDGSILIHCLSSRKVKLSVFIV